MSYKDVSQRLHTKEEFYYFFVHINQRLLPDINPLKPQYFRDLLNGSKQVLKLLDVRDYYFPNNSRNDNRLSAQRLYSIWTSHEVIRDFVPDPCTDQCYMIKVMATLDYDILVHLDAQLLTRRGITTMTVGDEDEGFENNKQ